MSGANYSKLNRLTRAFIPIHNQLLRYADAGAFTFRLRLDLAAQVVRVHLSELIKTLLYE